MKIRAIILIISTLLLGFILGILVSAQVRYHKLKPVRLFFSGEHFKEGLYRILEPDEKQSEKIDQILSRYAKVNNAVMSDFRRKSDSIMKEFWKEIEPTLTKDQKERLRELEMRRMKMMRYDWRKRNDSTEFSPRHMMPPGPPPDRFEPGMRRPFRGDTTDQSRI